MPNRMEGHTIDICSRCIYQRSGITREDENIGVCSGNAWTDTLVVCPAIGVRSPELFVSGENTKFYQWYHHRRQ
jgi:hypothetical protein